MADTKRRKSTARKIRRAGKRLSPGGIVLCLLLLLTGVVVGEIAYRALVRSDGFELVGEKVICIEVGKSYSYIDEGIVATRYGIDYSDRVTIETNLQKNGESYTMDTSEPGSYYMIYRIDAEPFRGLQKVRKFIVEE